MNTAPTLYFSDPIYETHYDILCEEQQRLQKQYDAAKEQQEMIQSDYQKLSQSGKKLAKLGEEFVNQAELDSKLSILPTRLTIKKAIVDGLSQQLNIIDQRKQENRNKQYDAGIERIQKEIFTENELQYFDMTMEHYRGIINKLPAVQNKILCSLVECFPSATASSIAQEAKMESKLVSAILAQMMDKGLVTQDKSGKKAVYTITDIYLHHFVGNYATKIYSYFLKEHPLPTDQTNHPLTFVYQQRSVK